jgi:hypothetical protein
MKLLGVLGTYLGATALLFGGLIGGVLWLVRPDPTAATASPRVAPISPRIAESIERKKMDARVVPTPVVQAAEAKVEPAPLNPVMHELPAALTPAPRAHIRDLQPRVTKRKAPRQEHAIARQEPAAVPEAPVPRPIATARTDFPY